MRISLPHKLALGFTGSIAAAIGAGILFLPQAFHATSGIVIGNDASLLSEVRAPGGLLLVAGLFVLAGIFRPRWAYPATVLGFALSATYVLSRLLSMALDGMPDAALLFATAIEVCMAAACGIALLRTGGGRKGARSMEPGAAT